jgi:hypothetical protein
MNEERVELLLGDLDEAGYDTSALRKTLELTRAAAHGSLSAFEEIVDTIHSTIFAPDLMEAERG